MILVTGGTGLVGSHLLLDLTKSGKKVRAIFRSKESISAVKRVFSYTNSVEETEKLLQQIEWLGADITDIPALDLAFDGIKEVYHCAALVSFDPSMDSRLRKVNIEGTANIANFCIKKNIQKLCFVSSIATLDKSSGESIISETSHWNKEKDHNMYSITKYGAEMEIWRASQEGIPVVIVNPGIIIGAGFWNSGSGEIFKRIAHGLKYFVPKTTGFVGVKDVVKIMQRLMNSPVENEQFIVVSENVSFETVLTQVAEALKQSAPKKKLKPWMVFTGWLLEIFRSPFSSTERKLNRHSSKTLFEDHFYSNKKVISFTGHRFEPIDETIKKTARFFRKDFSE